VSIKLAALFLSCGEGWGLKNFPPWADKKVLLLASARSDRFFKRHSAIFKLPLKQVSWYNTFSILEAWYENVWLYLETFA